MRLQVDSSAAAGLENMPFCIPTRCNSAGLPGLNFPFWVKGMASKARYAASSCGLAFCFRQVVWRS